MILQVQLDVAKQHCNFCAQHNEKEEHHQEVLEAVVVLIQPHRRQNEVILNKTYSKWENPANCHHEWQFHEEGLIRNLPLDAARLHRKLNSVPLVPKVGPNKHQRR